MNRRVAALAIVSILAALLLSGCSTTYFFSFTEEGDLGNDEGSWYMEDWYLSVSSVSPMVGGSYSFADKGLSMRGKAVTCPFKFSGDFTYIVRFWVYANAAHTLFFSLAMADGPMLTAAESFLNLEGLDVGSVDEAYAYFDATEPFMAMAIEDPMPGLIRDGRNAYELKKKGDSITMKMNGTLIAQFDLTDYDSEWFTPCVSSQLNFPYEGTFGIFIESVKVIYEDGMIDDTSIPV